MAAAAACTLKLRESVRSVGAHSTSLSNSHPDYYFDAESSTSSIQSQRSRQRPATVTAAAPRVASAQVSRFSLPMLRRPTTLPATDRRGVGGVGGDPAVRRKTGRGGGEEKRTEDDEGTGMVREGWLLRVELEGGAVGWGEASPLPGLHKESAAEAGAQLRAVASLLDGGSSGSGVGQCRTRGVTVPPELPLLGGAISEWLALTVGIRDPAGLLPSVRFAVESAVLSALAAASSSSVVTGFRNGSGHELKRPATPLAHMLLLGACGRVDIRQRVGAHDERTACFIYLSAPTKQALTFSRVT